MFSKYVMLGEQGQRKSVIAGCKFENGVAELDAPAPEATHNILTRFNGCIPAELAEKGEDGLYYPLGEAPKPKGEVKPDGDKKPEGEKAEDAPGKKGK